METRGTPPWLLALGKEAPPETIGLGDAAYRLERVFKHDFFAFTALYQGAHGRVVLKIGRRAPILGIPLSWIGRIHAWHESSVFREVDDLEIVPRFTGRHGRHGITHEYVPGHQLERGEHVPDDFFERLREGLAALHRRDLAYVDLEKPENVLVGDDGRPYLFDFQISYRWPFRRGGNLLPFRWLRQGLQSADRYHVRKLQRRTRPDQMSPAEIAAARRRPFPVELWTRVTRPLVWLRRRLLSRIDPGGRRGERGRVKPMRKSELVPPLAVRDAVPQPEADHVSAEL